MATFTVNLTDELKARAEAQAVAAGCGSIDEYLANLILSDAAVPLDPGLEADLLAGLNSPSRHMTDADWDENLRGLIARHKR